MVLALVILVGAVILARITGGRLAAFTELRVRGLRYVVIAIAGQAIGAVLAATTQSGTYYLAGLALSAAGALAFCLLNFALPGVPLVTLGLAANALVVGLNGAMPVSIFAASRAGVSIGTIAEGNDPRHTIAGYGSTWRTLGDVIPVPLPVVPEVASPGDVLVAAGLGELAIAVMRRRPQPAPVTQPRESAVALPG